ncbi:MAG: hypothetical protein ACLU3N_09895, partial [Lachnospiraceae bacterium]
GMTGVSKTLSGSSILSSPAHISRKAFRIKGFSAFLFYLKRLMITTCSSSGIMYDEKILGLIL